MKTGRKQRGEEVLTGLRSLFNLERLFKQKPKNDDDIVPLTDNGSKLVSRAIAILLDREVEENDTYTMNISPVEYRELIQRLQSLVDSR